MVALLAWGFYELAMLPPAAHAKMPDLPVLIIVGMPLIAALFFVLALAGTAAGRPLGLSSPLVEGWLAGARPRVPTSLGTAALVGAVTGLAVVGADCLIMPRLQVSLTGQVSGAAPWQGLLASLQAAVDEEVVFRLGLMSILAWSAWRLMGRRRRTLALGIGMLGAALLFGAAHLPAARALWPLTVGIVTRTVALNVAVGIVTGVLYVRRGLEHAVMAHLCADLVLHVVVPAVAPAPH
ncbi:MAG: CPBP family intramembrane metalloprotease [Minicystis sp.]